MGEIANLNKVNKETVLVTGAYGFLGKYVIEELLNNNYKVIAFGRNKEKMEELKRENVELFMGDFCNKEDAIEATKNVDYVIHCGALSTVWGKREDFITTNVDGTMNLVEGCRRNNVKRFVYVSSPSIYAGKEDRTNIKEEDYDKSNKLNYYIESKILAEEKLNEIKDINWVIIRPRGLFGVGDTSIIPRLIRVNSKIGLPLFNKGQNFVDMTCVENVAYALRLCIQKENIDFKTYNITNGEPQYFKGLLEELFNALGVKPKYMYININVIYAISCMIEFVYKVLHIYKEPMITRYNVCTLGYSQTLDISKAKKDLEYNPVMTLSEGIKKYAKEYNKN